MRNKLIAIFLSFALAQVQCLTNVSIFYETLCQDSQRFFNEQVQNVIERFGSGGVFFTLVPYGRTIMTDSPLNFTCPHGGDCTTLLWHTCVIRLFMNRNDDVINYALCTMDHPTMIEWYDECSVGFEEDRYKIKRCVQSDEGLDNMRLMALYTGYAAQEIDPVDKILPKIPTVFVDGKPMNEKQMANLVRSICEESFSKPKGCDQLHFEDDLDVDGGEIDSGLHHLHATGELSDFEGERMSENEDDLIIAAKLEQAEDEEEEHKSAEGKPEESPQDLEDEEQGFGYFNIDDEEL